MMVALGVVLVMAREIRHGPTVGRALQAMFGGRQGDGHVKTSDVDTRLLEDRPASSMPDAFISPREVQPPADAAESLFSGVNPAFLGTVRDDAFFRAAEYDAWFHLFQILAKTDPAELARASEGRVSFVQLFQQSNDYRGRLVSLKGTVRRAFPLRPPKNDYGIDRYYQLWLFTDDNPSSPVILYCLEIPEDFPTGMTLVEPVEVVGFYFKRLAYEAADTLRTAPTLLARGIQWQPAPATEPVGPPSSGSPWMVLGVAAAFSAAIVAYVYLKTRPIRPKGQDLEVKLPESPQEDLADARESV
ncbi:MAG: hypothetical protein U1E05_09170 [Patescibacteria group bacterium]|nr:hypothetical protein [Patescibacteria group bacterium]